MSHDPHDDTHGASKIHASKGGGGAGKWLIGAGAAAVVLAGGYYAWQNYTPTQSSAQSEMAYNEYADDPVRAGPIEDENDPFAEPATADDESAAAPASAERRAAAPARRTQSASADTVVPEETIGITPVNATESEAIQDSDEIVVRPPQGAVWSSVPSARRLSAFYPESALNRGREGEARLACTVMDGGSLDCIRASETSSGFGCAALRVARSLRHASTRADGTDAAGTPVNLRVVFRLEDEDRRVGRG